MSSLMERSKSLPGLQYSSLYGEGEAQAGVGLGKAYSFNGPSVAENGDDDANPEVKRRRRVATYNKYAVEGKLKSSLRNSFKWIKSKFVHSAFYDHPY